MTLRVDLPWPPSSLSGHAKGHWRDKSGPTATYRSIAKDATETAVRDTFLALPETGDLLFKVRFVPPDNRGDRLNFTSRLKPYADGIAEALGVNDKRFLPHFEYAKPEKGNGRIEVTITEGE